MGWHSRIDVDRVTAIDIHVHAGRSATAPPPIDAPTRDDTLARASSRQPRGYSVCAHKGAPDAATRP
jgi:hypothetical protein